MTPLFAALHKLPREATHKARSIVLDIINASETPLATRDIYKLAAKPARPDARPPHSDQEIRSMRYLKTVVLEDLARRKRVEKVRIQDPFTAWLWRPTKVSSAPEKARTKSAESLSASSNTTEPAATSAPSLAELTPAAVGAGEDWSHLNKRRRNVRWHKFGRDVKKMREVVRRENKAAQR